ncbi:MAG: hypothetical protein VXW65_05490 [Pseudomonadota bacterium]|nr:hypothetical protein [Pseudomonadota bacterium]
MHTSNILITLAFITTLTGCAQTPTTASNPSDPDVLLGRAEALQKQGLPIPALYLTQQAIQHYQQQHNLRNLGYAYLSYAALIRSDQLAAAATFKIRRSGLDPVRGITLENRQQQAHQLEQQALQTLLQAEQQYLASNQFDKLSNVYYNQALAYQRLQQPQQVCIAYDNALAAHHTNLRQNPTASPQTGASGQSVDAQLRQLQAQQGCL